MNKLSDRFANLSPEKRALLMQRLMKKAAERPHTQGIPKRTSSGPLPLSFSQERLWFLEELQPDSPAFLIPLAIRMDGRLDKPALERSLQEIQRRHETLRTVFKKVDGRPVQTIIDAPETALRHIDLGDLPEAEKEAEALRLADEEAQRPFDLAKGPYFRSTLLRLREQSHVLLITFHHAVADGWSMDIFVREFARLYEGFCNGTLVTLPALPIQYGDFALWQRQWLQGETLVKQLFYWKEQLDSAPPLLELPTDHPRPAAQSYRGAYETLKIPPAVTGQLKTLSRECEATLFMALLVAFKTLLFRYSGIEKIVVGTPTAGRTRTEIEGLIGFFVNNLVLCSDVRGDTTFRELLERVREVTLGAFAHQDIPFEKLVEELQPARDMSYSPLFQVMFILQTPSQKLALPELALSALPVHSETAKYDLTLTMVDTAEGLEGGFEYNTDLFDASTIQRMVQHFQTLLEGIVADPDQRIADLQLLPEAEKKQLLQYWNITEKDYPQDKCFHHLFEAQTAQTPDAIALSFLGDTSFAPTAVPKQKNSPFEEGQGDVYNEAMQAGSVSDIPPDPPSKGGSQNLSFRELNTRANQLAHYLIKQGVGPETLVGLCIERSPEMLVGLLGILKAGAAYVPLDPAYPSERIAYVLEDAKTPVLISSEATMRNWELGVESGESGVDKPANTPHPTPHTLLSTP
ncbi:MAG: condensation domain-containing protein, partial [bacterium]